MFDDRAFDTPERFRNDTMPFSNVLQEHYTKIFRRRSKVRKQILAGITSGTDAELYVKNIRSEIKKRFNLPTEHSPLQAKSVYTKEFADHVIEGIYFFSRPGVAVSGLLLYPRRSGKHPAVLFLCGHSLTGKLSYYQPIASDLARQGYAVLLIDPMGQGERKETELSPTCEHNSFGRRLALAGEQFAAWRVYDAIRAIDYLESRPEADCAFLGVTGCSGGCTLGSFVMALDDRPKMAALSCGITSFLHNVENELPCDIEQLPQTLGSLSMEMADFLIAAAPRPILLLEQENDFFDPRGTCEAFSELKKFYQLLGHPGNVELFTDNVWHNFSAQHRAAMMRFFSRYTKLPALNADEVDNIIIPAEELYCAPDGRITNIEGGKPQFQLIIESCRQAAARRKKHSPEELRALLMEKLAVGTLDLPYYRVLRPDFKDFNGRRYIGRFGIETESDTVMAVLKQASRPDKGCYRLAENSDVLLFIGNLDSGEELLRRPELTQTGKTICALDVRGIGELTPGGCDRPEKRDFFHKYQFDYHFAALGDFLAEPMLGKRVRDILLTVKLLQSRNCTVELYGCGQGAIAALFAAFLGNIAGKVENLPPSYLSYVESNSDILPQAVLPFNILDITDLDELLQYSEVEIVLPAAG